MANNKSFIALIFVLCLNLISTNIYAANVGGWTLGGGVAQGASTVYQGTKKVVIDGVDYIKKGTAKITPPASGVAKVLARGAAGYALSVAVEQLLGAVDWVLDPANNQIKYRLTSPDDPSNFQYRWRWDYNKPQFDCYSISSCLAAGNAYQQYMVDNKLNHPSGQITFNQCNFSGTNIKCTGTAKDGSYRDRTIARFANDAYNPNADTEEKTLPLETVAAQVISNAEGNTDKKAGAQVATTAAAADIVAEAETDETKSRPITDQLNKSSSTKPADSDAAANAGTGTATATPQADPVTGEQAPPTDIALKFPVFCNWAPTVCEAAQVVISFPQTLTNWWETGKSKAEEWALSISEAWTAAKEWATTEKDSEDTEVDVEQLDLEAESVDINLASGCPAPVVFIDSDFYGQPFKIEFSFDGFCSILSDWVRPILISLGAFIAALILGGVKVNE